jgi:hypothetical protein
MSGPRNFLKKNGQITKQALGTVTTRVNITDFYPKFNS